MLSPLAAYFFRPLFSFSCCSLLFLSCALTPPLSLCSLFAPGSKVVEDPSYRYKMPRLVARIEGRGNGIKTCMVNLGDIATSLNRPPDIVTKYFGVELGAQSRWEADVRRGEERA